MDNASREEDRDEGDRGEGDRGEGDRSNTSMAWSRSLVTNMLLRPAAVGQHVAHLTYALPKGGRGV